MQNLSPLKMPSTIERQTLINPEFISAESSFSIIRKIIVTQQIEQENAIEKMEVFGGTSATTDLFGRAYATTDLLGRANATTDLLGRASATTDLFGRASATTDLFGRASATTDLFGRASATTDLFGRASATTGKHLSPVFFFIENNDLENLEKLITEYPEILNQKYESILTPVFFAIEHNNLEALQVIIKSCPEILEQKLEDDLTPIFFAIEGENLKALRIIIEKRPETLWQKYDEYVPIFFVINDEYLEAITTIIEAHPQVLEQEDANKNIPLIKIVELYDNEPSEPNKNLLQNIFEQQFNRKLEDDTIENLVNFVRNLHLFKLLYEDAGQILKENNLKKILYSVIIFDHDEKNDLTKELTSIYQKICQEKISEITFFNQKGEQNSLHIYNSEIRDHSSYFIFHVDEKNKLTAVSYCDGNLICNERKLKSNYINGVITYDFKILIDFSQEMVKNFINKNFKEKDMDIFYKEFKGLIDLFKAMISNFIIKNFNEKDANILCEKITETDFLKTTYSIPTKFQTKENCTFKSINILARFLLEEQQQETIFGFDFASSQPNGIGHEAYKKLKEQMIENASKNFILSGKKLGKDFCEKVKFSENIRFFLEKSSKKKTPATRFSQSSVEKITEFLASNEVDYVAISRKRNFSQLL